MTDKKFKCASLFAGVGGIDLGFKLTNHFETVYANEFDPYPAKTFMENFDIDVDIRPIQDVNSIPNVDVVMGGFPCQAFSVAGYRKGFEDTRGTLFFDMLRLIKNVKPRIVFAENVKNLVSHDNGKTFDIIVKSLEQEGYHVKYKVLNAMDYGNIPQNRERIYIVAFLNEEDYKNFEFPDHIIRTLKLTDVIDYRHKVNEKYYYTKGKFKDSIYNEIEKNVTETNAVYQWRRRYVRKNKSGVVPTLTANMGEGGHNVPLIKTRYGIRKLTPKECFNVQGFPTDFKLPDLIDTKLYKQAGNSVCVTVIERIANNIYKAMHDTDKNKKVIIKCPCCGNEFEYNPGL